jgi:hypothetical protein
MTLFEIITSARYKNYFWFKNSLNSSEVAANKITSGSVCEVVNCIWHNG